MPIDEATPLLYKEGKVSRFLRYIKGATKAGKAGKDIYSKAKQYSVATQNRGERAFATFAKAADYIDTAAWAFPPAKAFTKPIAFASGKINSLLELRAFIKMHASNWDELVPLKLEEDLLKLRDKLADELNVNAASDTWEDPGESPLIQGIDAMIAMIQQQNE
jgi:hypothetical protein